MKDERYMRVTVEAADVESTSPFKYKDKSTWESAFPDVECSRIVDGFISCMRGIGFCEVTVIEAMEEAIAEWRSVHPELDDTSDDCRNDVPKYGHTYISSSDGF